MGNKWLVPPDGKEFEGKDFDWLAPGKIIISREGDQRPTAVYFDVWGRLVVRQASDDPSRDDRVAFTPAAFRTLLVKLNSLEPPVYVPATPQAVTASE
jgi:hypothetical protein